MELFAILIIFLSVAFYFLPTIVAVQTDSKNTPAILLLNLLLGWTFIFWVISLVWAVKKPE